MAEVFFSYDVKVVKGLRMFGDRKEIERIGRVCLRFVEFRFLVW